MGHEAGGVVQEEELPQPRPHQTLPRLTAQLACRHNHRQVSYYLNKGKVSVRSKCYFHASKLEFLTDEDPGRPNLSNKREKNENFMLEEFSVGLLQWPKMPILGL